MKCRSKKIADNGQRIVDRKRKLYAIRCTLKAKPAFSLVEATTALILLALISSSVLVVINRCMVSAADLAARCQAFEVARENMESLLSRNSVEEIVEYGSSDKYPEIQWQTTVEAFYEPISSRMWIRGICSAEYTDSAGQVQTIELTHWLTSLTKKDVLKILEQRKKEKERLAERVIQAEEEAADYAGVDVQTIRQWVANGMLKTKDGHCIKGQLDLYKQTGGNPTIAERKLQAQADAELIGPAEEQAEQGKTEDDDGVKRIGGRTLEELVEMGLPRELLEELFEELFKDL